MKAHPMSRLMIPGITATSIPAPGVHRNAHAITHRLTTKYSPKAITIAVIITAAMINPGGSFRFILPSKQNGASYPFYFNGPFWTEREDAADVQ